MLGWWKMKEKEKERLDFIRLNSNHLSLGEMSDRLGIKEDTLKRFARKHGVAIDSKQKRYDKISALAGKMSVDEIAELMGSSKASILSFAYRNDIDLKVNSIERKGWNVDLAFQMFMREGKNLLSVFNYFNIEDKEDRYRAQSLLFAKVFNNTLGEG